MKKLLLLCYLLLSVGIAYAQPPSRVPDADTPQPGTAWHYYENRGQIIDNAQNIRNDIKYYTTHSGTKMHLGEDTISVTGHNWTVVDDTTRVDSSFRLDMQFFCPARDLGQPCTNTIAVYEPSRDSLNYYLPHCGDGIEGVPGYAGVVYQDAFPSTDVHFFSSSDGPITYFVFHPGSDTGAFALMFTGQDSMAALLNSLHVFVGQHDISLSDCIAYQVDNSGNVLPIGWSPFWYIPNAGMAKLQLGPYNPAYDLIIRTGSVGNKTAGSGSDNLIWTSYYGESGSEANPDSSRKWSVDGMPIIKGDVGSAGGRVLWHATTTNSPTFDIKNGITVVSSQFKHAGNYDILLSQFEADSCTRI
jgi:hypothetical protein